MILPHRLINIFHILFVAPLLLVVAYMGESDPLPIYLVVFLIILSMMVSGYHLYRYFS